MGERVNRVERLTGLLLALQRGQQSAQQLADRFEVSRRTILRDLDALSRIGVPLIATQGRGGGFRVQEGYWLPPLHLSQDEAAAVLFALGLAEDHRGGSPLGQAQHSAREKLESALGTDIRLAARSTVDEIRVTHHHASPDPATIDLIRTSIREERWLRVAYRGARGESTRTVLPVSLTVSFGKWYVQAVDDLRSAMRIFRVDRFVEVRKALAPANAADLISTAHAGNATYGEPSNPRVEVLLTEIGLQLALDHPDFHSRIAHDGASPSLRFHCPEHELPYYASEILRFGPEAQIISPPELSHLAIRQASSLLEHHQPEMHRPSPENDDRQVSP
jgi:predicted DNA-binding transcriptional regulator YafY